MLTVGIILIIIAIIFVLAIRENHPESQPRSKEKPEYTISTQELKITMINGEEIFRTIRVHNEPYEWGPEWLTPRLPSIEEYVDNYCARISKEGFRGDDEHWILPYEISSIGFGPVITWQTNGELTWEK